MDSKKGKPTYANDSSLSPDRSSSPLRSVFCLKNRNQIEKFELEDDCFVLEFDPYDELNIAKSKKETDNTEDSDVCVISEKGQVACRDYPHSRNMCAKFPFEMTPHHSHCRMCYCYVCDMVAPVKNGLEPLDIVMQSIMKHGMLKGM